MKRHIAAVGGLVFLMHVIVVLGGVALATLFGVRVFAHPPDAHGQHQHKESTEGKNVLPRVAA